ncbi:MAG: hypothetical protein H8E26_09415 [FCB group bacterium]|nr:hypothetical protein [FCB group bacterium]MBL7029127.1 hypothetical protein [Candidatus Neomarinimicrobiota bacterium]MBL7122038.1 hypothetical protein [Candidatus Neomarinimicrobiota bacterium]
MSKDVFANHRTNSIIIIVLIALFISVIYLPKTIWDYEAELRDEARFRMNAVSLAEKLHYQLVKEYTTDPEQLLLVVNSVKDSLLAAAMDTNYSYYGSQSIALAPRSISVNYSDEYKQLYNELHLELFKTLEPNHNMDPNTIDLMLDSIKTLFDVGNYVGEQSMEIDSVGLNFTVSDKFDILYQNIKTSMFNALTTSYTKYPSFSNPLVDAVMDSIAKNQELSGRIEFSGIYDGAVRVDFIIPSNFEENMAKTLETLKKQFVFDSYDSATYGDTLYDMALTEFLVINDTLDTMPDYMTLMYFDTSGIDIEIPVEVKVRDMEGALSKRRNNLYKRLTGYSEPSPYIAEQVIAVALDSLDSPNAGLDSIHLDIDLTDAVFNINVHKNISEYFSTVSLEQAYYKSAVNLSDLDWEKAAVEVVEFVGDRLIKKSDFLKWQVVEVESDTFNVNVYDEFLRKYDDMNLTLAEKLTGEFINIHNRAREIVGIAEHMAGVDTLDWRGEQVIEFAADTLLVDVFPTYLSEYDTTFTIARDTVVQLDDSTFNGVWYRGMVGVSQDFSLDSLPFLAPMANSNYRYDFNGTDSVLSMNILEKSDTAYVEKVYYGQDQFILIFAGDSLLENLFLIADSYAEFDSIQIDSLSVVSDEFVAGDNEKSLFMEKDSFGGWIDTTINKKYVKKQLFSHYQFDPMLTKCTVTDLPYRITVRNNVNLGIESPIEHPIETSRYVFFTQIDSTHGSLVDGEESWAK